jgi:fibronectin type 3 domain-containing protein
MHGNKLNLVRSFFLLSAVFLLGVVVAGCGGKKTSWTAAAPTGVSAVPGDAQSTIAWTPVADATTYNIYWSTTSGVTVANGTKITGATGPYTQTQLTNGTTYYYVVTAVDPANSSFESVPSVQASCTPGPGPSGVSATPGNGQATVVWSPLANATSYNISWSTTSGVTPANGTTLTGVTTPYTLSGLTNGTTYYLVVTALFAGGEARTSSQVSVTPTTTPPPAAPTGVSATPGGGQATVAWTLVPGATSYNIYWSTTPGLTAANGTQKLSATNPYTLKGLADKTSYYFVVTAVNAKGESTISAQASCTPVQPIPTGVSAFAGDRQATIVWTPVSGAISYNIYWSTFPGVTPTGGYFISGASDPYTLKDLVNGTSYYFVVTAVYAAGESVASTEVSAVPALTTPPVAPAAPTGVSATLVGGQATIAWTPVSGANFYNVYWSTTPGVTAASGTQITGATNPYTQTLQTNGVTYYYVVTAVNNNGESAASTQVSATPTAPPSAPTGVTATPASGQATISWSPVSGATSYHIYWSTTTGVTPAHGTQITVLTSPYTQTLLTNGTTYYYVVTAVNGNGESLPSNQVGTSPAP